MSMTCAEGLGAVFTMSERAGGPKRYRSDRGPFQAGRNTLRYVMLRYFSLKSVAPRVLIV